MNYKLVSVILLVCLSAAVMGEISGDGKGTLTIATRAYNNLFSKEVLVWQEDTNGSVTFTDFVYLNPSGKYEGRYLPGLYTIYLFDGNGGQPETGKVKVDAGYQSWITFIGHAAGTGTDEPEYVCYWVCINKRICDANTDAVSCITEPRTCTYERRYEWKCGYFSHPLSRTVCYEDG